MPTRRQCCRLAYVSDRAAELDGLGSGRRQTRIYSLSLPPNRAADVRTMMTDAAWAWVKGDVVLWRRTSFKVAPRRDDRWRIVGSRNLFRHGCGRASLTELPLRGSGLQKPIQIRVFIRKTLGRKQSSRRAFADLKVREIPKRRTGGRRRLSKRPDGGAPRPCQGDISRSSQPIETAGCQLLINSG